MPRTCPLLPLLLLLALLLPGSLEARQEVDDILRRIEAPRTPDAPGPEGLSLPELLEAAGVPGLSVAVVQEFQLHWSRGYGVADVETRAPVGEETLFQAASISKPVTAMAALRLTREGRLALDGNVNHLLRSWQVPVRPEHTASPVTPRSLFSHTSGADDGFGFPGYDPGAPRPDALGILNGDPPSNVGPVRFARPPTRPSSTPGAGPPSCSSPSPN